MHTFETIYLSKLPIGPFRLLVISAKAEQQQEHLAAISAKADQQHAEMSAKADQQQAEFTALGNKMKEIPKEVKKGVQPLQKKLEEQKPELENHKTALENQKTTLEILEEQLRKLEGRPQPSNKWQMVPSMKPSTIKIPTFDGTGPQELYHKQFEAAAAHNQWTDMEKAVALTLHLEAASVVDF